MERTPHASDALVQTPHRLRDLLQLLSIRIAQQQRLVQNLIRVHVSHTDGLFAAIDVLAFDDGVFVRTRRYGDFDAGVFFRKCREFGLEEVAVNSVLDMSDSSGDDQEGVLHATTAAGPVAIVKVQAFALEDEGSHAILCPRC